MTIIRVAGRNADNAYDILFEWKLNLSIGIRDPITTSFWETFDIKKRQNYTPHYIIIIFTSYRK